MAKVITENGEYIDFEAAVALMDDEIRESVHNDFSPCTEQEFFTEYERRHLERYGIAFVL